MRIGEKTDVEDQIGLMRQAQAIGKGRHENRQRPLFLEPEMSVQNALQVRQDQIAGMDDRIGALAQRFEQAALVSNPVHDRPIQG